MTRFLEKDKGTQVNSNLIGVQVHPDVVPPTYEVIELNANVAVKDFGCTNTSNGLPMLYVSDTIWAYTGSQEEYGGTVYNVWSCVMGSETVSFLTDSNDTITDQTQFYIHIDDPNVPPVLNGPISDYMLKYEGSLRQFDPNGDYWYPTDDNFVQTYLNGDPVCDLEDGFFLSKETGRWIGQFTYNTVFHYEEFICDYVGESGDYFQWRVDYSADVYLYSTVRNPAVGDNLISNDQGTEAYTSQVLTVYEDEVDPGYTEDVDCKVEYSVDGETWTAWEENLTDDNNVIANIPRYMYLKFGQDVEITEE